MSRRTTAVRGWLLIGALTLGTLSGCMPARPQRSAERSAAQAHALIDAALPASVRDRTGWADDLYSVFGALGLPLTSQHLCAVLAVTEQESDLRVDPVVPGLAGIAWRQIDRDARHAGIPPPIVHEVLRLRSPDGRTYEARIDAARTEKDLSDIFEDFTGSIPLGRRLFASWNPIRTRGPMQVNVDFAHKFEAVRPYPWPHPRGLDDELFTRRGSLYFGTAHLLAYVAPYDSYLYRFADYNAGQYSSRNAAFQRALSLVSGAPLVADGALIVPKAPVSRPGATERAVWRIAARLGLDRTQIHTALEQDRDASFQHTELYRRVFALAARRVPALPPAALPDIELQGPKLHTHLTTAWYARRVQDRFERCLTQVHGDPGSP